MSRNGSGIYTLPAGNPVVTGTVIASTWANNTLTDIASALTASIASDGQTPMVGDLDLNTNKIINLEAGTVAGNAVEYDQFVAATTTAVAITGGTIDGTPIGNTTRSSGKFTTLAANGATTLTSTLDVTGAVTMLSTLDVTGFASFDSNGEFNGTGALKVPAGTTGQQPTPATGMLRFNTTSTNFEGYNGTAWGSIAAPAGSNTQIQYNNSGNFGASSALTFNGTTLAVPNISDGTNSTSTTNVVKGSAKAWVNFNGTTATIRSGYNVSSITRNGVGDVTISFTTALPNADYAWSYGSNNSDDSFVAPANATIFKTTLAYQTASSLRIMTTLNNAASAGAADITLATVIVHSS